MDASERVRLDKWLWAARFFKTRSLASQAIERGRVCVDGERVKPAREVKIGDRLLVQAGEQRFEILVRALSAQRGPAPAARALYEETGDSAARRARQAEQRVAEPARSIKGRPTKRDRRDLQRVSGS
jgi:ribosome-associated heat shock protein Hsp15